MEIKDVQRSRHHERRTYRINIRITESQNTFIRKNNLSITKILNEALKQLGYVPPTPQELTKSRQISRQSVDRFKSHHNHRKLR